MNICLVEIRVWLGKWLCAHGFHAWEKEPKRENHELIKFTGDFGIFSTGHQYGTVECTRPGCTANHRVEREGVMSMFGGGTSTDWKKCD